MFSLRYSSYLSLVSHILDHLVADLLLVFAMSAPEEPCAAATIAPVALSPSTAAAADAAAADATAAADVDCRCCCCCLLEWLA